MDVAVDHPEVLLDDWEHEIDIDPPFTGRHHDLKLLEEAMAKRFRLFGVFGVRSVGKSRLVKELLNRYTRSCNGTNRSSDIGQANATDNDQVHPLPTIIRLDLGQQTDTSAVYANLCASIGESPEANNTNDKTWILQIYRYVKKARKTRQFIFFFDNVENAEEDSQLSDGLKSLFWHLTSKCVNIRVFITSTTKFMSSQLQRVYFCHELLPLRPTESSELLRVIAPSVDLGEYKDVIVKLSEGLPLLLSMIANELADDEGLITPKDMAELLATSRLKCLSRRDFYAEEDSIADIYRKFIERLQKLYRRRLAVLGYIPGSFDVREAKAVLGLETEAQTKDQALIPIRRRYMLTYDPDTRRFNIQGILRECLEVFFAIKNITDIRKKYCEVFSQVMGEIAEKLGTEDTVKAMSQFSLEQPNFQKLMKQVYYTTEDNYRFFITMATKCTDLIERFLLRRPQCLYEQLQRMQTLSRTIDLLQACWKDFSHAKELSFAAEARARTIAALGGQRVQVERQVEQLYPFGHGGSDKDSFIQKECDMFYNGCLTIAGQYGNDVDTAVVNIAVGSMWTNAKNDLQKGADYYRGALKVLVSSGNRLQLATIYQRMGWNLHRQGKNVEAVRFFQKSLNISQSGGPEFHRLCQQSMNSLGVTNTILGNYADAERYHFTSLRRAKATLKANHPQLGFIYNNIGVFYAAKGDPENALRYYLEGLENKKMNKAAEASLLLSYSNVAAEYSSLKQYDQAHELLDESLQVLMKQEIPSKATLALTYDTKGKVLMAQRKYANALEMFEKAVDIRESLTPEGITYVESLVHVAAAKQRLEKNASCIKTVKKVMNLRNKAKETMPQNTFIAECYECLAEVYLKIGDDRKYMETLENLESELCRLEDVHMCACNEPKLERVRKQLGDIRDKIRAFRQSRLVPTENETTV